MKIIIFIILFSCVFNGILLADCTRWNSLYTCKKKINFIDNKIITSLHCYLKKMPNMRVVLKDVFEGDGRTLKRYFGTMENGKIIPSTTQDVCDVLLWMGQASYGFGEINTVQEVFNSNKSLTVIIAHNTGTNKGSSE